MTRRYSEMLRAVAKVTAVLVLAGACDLFSRITCRCSFHRQGSAQWIAAAWSHFDRKDAECDLRRAVQSNSRTGEAVTCNAFCLVESLRQFMSERRAAIQSRAAEARRIFETSRTSPPNLAALLHRPRGPPPLLSAGT